MVVDFGQITWTTCTIVSLCVNDTENISALTIFTRLLIHCVWDYGSRNCVLSHSPAASDKQQGLENFVLLEL